MSVFYCEIKDDLADLRPHHVPIDEVALPLRVQSESFSSPNMEWDGIFDIFIRICEDNGFEVGVTSNCQAFASRELQEGIYQRAFIEHKTNHFIFQVWTIITNEKFLVDVSDLDYILDVGHYFNLPLVCSILVWIEDEWENSDPSFFFGDKKVFASEIKDRDTQLWTAYSQDTMGRDLFVVIPTSFQGRKWLERDAVKTADTIIHLKTLFHLITQPKNNFRSMVDEIRRIEREIDKTIEDITINLTTRDLDEIRGWLKQISVDFVRFNTFKQQLEQHFTDMQLYQEEVETLLTWWKEEPVGDEPTLSLVVQTHINRFSRDYKWLYRRITDFTARLDNMLGILRTRVDILNQSQLLATERNIHAALDAQLNTHHKLQGLYSVFAAFYFTEISYVIFEALHHKGWIHISAAEATAPLIPLYFVAGLVLSGTYKRIFKKKHTVEPGENI